MLESDNVLLLTHKCDCGAIFDRVYVHWPIGVQISHSVRLCMDYEDSNCVKTDRIWFKTAKRLHLVLQERVTIWLLIEAGCLTLLSRMAFQANGLLCIFDP